MMLNKRGGREEGGSNLQIKEQQYINTYDLDS